MELERDATNAWDGRDWFAILLLALLVTVAFADILFLGRNFYVRDVYTFYYPTKKLIRDLVLSGQFPQWNPHYGAGQPLAANPEYEIFYPLQWLIFLPGYALAFRLHILVHFYLAIGGAYAFFRSLDLRRAASAAGAISFALGGMLLSTTALLPYLFILAWAPWLALHARRYLLGGSYRDLALAATALGMQFLVGEPTTVMQSVFVLVTAAFFIGSVSVSLRRTAAIVGAGFLIGAAQIFPTIDFARDTVRSWVFPYPLVVSWSLPPVRLLELLHPTLFGRYFDSMQWYWGGSLYTTGTPFFWSIYCGVAVAILALAGLVTESRGRWLFAIVSVFSILLAAGGHTPFFAALYDAGLLRNLRYPEKFILMEACAVIAFGTVVLDRILDRDRRTFRVALSIAAALAAVSFLVAVLSSTASFQPLFASMFRLVPSPSTDYETTLASVEWWKETARLLLFAALLGAWCQAHAALISMAMPSSA